MHRKVRTNAFPSNRDSEPPARETWMRFSIPIFTITTALATASLCDAGGLWGNSSTPYAVGYAPATTQATAVAVPSAVVTAPAVTAAPATGAYSAAYAPSYRAGYTPARTPYLGVAPSATMPVTTTVGTNGAYQAQRPSYVDNPSVYTGLPVTGNVQTSFRAPLSTAPVTTAFPSSTYQAGYAAYQGVVPSTQPVAVPANTGIPAAAVAAPAVPVYPSTSPPSSGGCLSRFCQKLFGTGYTTSYYRAPVTYYRPVTTISPVTGTAVTVQQPCTAYEQQVQRTPFTTFQPSPLTPPPSNNCASTADSCNTMQPAFGTPTTTPFGAAPSGGVGQVNAIGSGDSQTVPIPSIPPAGQGYPSNGNQNLAPLTGTPPTLAPPSFGQYQQAAPSTPAPTAPPSTVPPTTSGNSGDMAPVDQPSLNKAPTEETSEEKDTNQTSRPPSYWQLQNAEDSTAMISPRTAPSNDPASLSGGYGQAQPIRAPSDYVAPFGRTQTPANTANTPIGPPPSLNTTAPATTPSLPRPDYDPSDMTSVSHRQYAPSQFQGRQSTSGNQAAPAASPQPRDTTWISIGQ